MVPIFTNIWVECLGDLKRYRIAVEDDNWRDRKTWSDVSYYWYKKATDQNPNIGRLAHYFAILFKFFIIE